MGWVRDWYRDERVATLMFGRQPWRRRLSTLWTAAVWGPPGRVVLRPLGRWRCLLCGEPLPREGVVGHSWCPWDAGG